MLTHEVLESIKAVVKAAVSEALNDRQPSKKQFYSTEEFANLVGRKVETIQAWCRDNRIHAIKKKSGYGASKEWTISHAEYERYQKERLLPNPFTYRHKR